MDYFKWEAGYETGFAEIDRQHKKLVGFLNKLHAAMKEGQGFAVMDEILNGLVNYTVEHFSYEEGVMMSSNYTSYIFHKQEHEKLIEEVQRFRIDFTARKRTLSVEVMLFLKNWLQHHILEIDMQLGKYIAVKYG